MSMLDKTSMYFLGEINGFAEADNMARADARNWEAAVETWKAAHQSLLEEVETLKAEKTNQVLASRCNRVSWRETVERFAAETRKLLPPEQIERFDRLFEEHFSTAASGPALENCVLAKVYGKTWPTVAEIPPSVCNGLPAPAPEGEGS